MADKLTARQIVDHILDDALEEEYCYDDDGGCHGHRYLKYNTDETIVEALRAAGYLKEEH